MTSYYATYAIEGICTVSHVTLRRNYKIQEEIRRELLKELKQPLADKNVILNEKEALTYAETSEEHGRAAKIMSTRFSFAVLLSPEFEVNEKGEIKVERFPILETADKTIKPIDETLSFIKTSILPKIENSDYKQLITQYLMLH